MPLILSVEIIIIYFILKHYNMLLLKRKETYLASGVIVLVYLLHPSMINTLVSIMSCRDIGGV